MKVNTIANKIYHFYLKHEKYRSMCLSKLLLKCLKKINPSISIIINERLLVVPFSDHTAIYKAKFKKFNSAVERIAQWLEDNEEDLKIIDIGANVGDTINEINKVNAEYIAIEGEKFFYDYLLYNTSCFDVKYEPVFLSDVDEDKNIYTEIKNGTARIINNSNDINNTTFVTLDRLMSTKYPEFVATFIKIDTDGYDFKVLRGGVSLYKEM